MNATDDPSSRKKCFPDAQRARSSRSGEIKGGGTRREHDLLGKRDVPGEYYYGIQTLRALENFPISGVTLDMFPALIEALAMVKMAAAKANEDLGLFPTLWPERSFRPAGRSLLGKLHNQFVVDMIQGGAGTSTNMNANEVIANRALETPRP